MHLTAKDILDVLKAAKQRSTRDHAMILLAYRHGLRCSEVCGLKLADIDMKNHSITIHRLKNSLQTTQPLCEHAGQPLLNEPIALRAWLRERGDGDGSDYLFLSQKGGKLDRSAFYRAFNAVAQAAGLEPCQRHPHTLKHALASHLVQRNVNLAEVRQALGHRSISSTMVYVGVSDSQAGAAVKSALMALY
jgi:type 1 fimbriae regulatory protein FimB